MKKTNQHWIFGESKFTLQKENPETGWKQLQNQNATDFWIPNDLFNELTGSVYLKESVKDFRKQILAQYKVVEEKTQELKKMKLALDSKRKSAEYYKAHRDEIRDLLTKAAKKYSEAQSIHEEELEYAIAKTEQWKTKFFDLQDEHRTCKRNLTKYIMVFSSLLGLSLLYIALF